MSHDKHHGNDHKGGGHHFILSYKSATLVGLTLLVLTAVTVGIAGIDLGRFNFFVAMVVATIKALLVALIFMNLRNDKLENGIIFGASFMFLAIFFVLTFADLFFRGDVYWKEKGQPFPPIAGVVGKPKFKKAWNQTPEILAHGKQLYAVQCVSCHGADGKGDGPAAAALIPHPRNFHSNEGWKNGRKLTMVFKTLKEGIPGSGMASFATLPAEDRWAVAHYVLSLNGPAEKDSAADFAKIGVDPNKEDAGGSEKPTIPVAVAMERMAEKDTIRVTTIRRPYLMKEGTAEGVGAQIYRTQCASCHGERAQGGVEVKNLGGFPNTIVKTSPIGNVDSGRFQEVVLKGLPGDLMPGHGEFSVSEIRELYNHVRTLKQ
ncbi:c-type cytochrome [bacterium]|jgi:caa(3)-type oxidase subunit IV|nr:c-type cytochrome [bacterium]